MSSRSSRSPGERFRLAGRVLAVAAFSACLASYGVPRSPPVRRPRSLLLVVVDTLRFDAGDPSGALDAAVPGFLQTRGTHFTNALAASDWTSPSTVALMTGHYPSDCGLLSVDGIAEYPAEWTLATLLRSAGYQTHAVVSNPTLSGSRLRLQAGFDTFDDKMTGVERNRPIGTRTAPATTEAALSVLSRLRSSAKPWFLWVHYLEPHGPYHAPFPYPRAGSDPGPSIPLAGGDIAPRGFLPRYQFLPECRGRNDYAVRYRSSAAWALDEADRLLTMAEKKGWLRDAVVVFTSDHGEFLGESDFWFQHGIRLHPAVVHVPLVVARTPSEPRTREIRPVSHLDFFPTMANLLALRAPAGLPGQDLFGRSVSRTKPILIENIAFPDSAEVGVVQNGRLVIKSTESAPESFQIGRDDWPQVVGEISRAAVAAVDGELQRVRKLPIPTRKVPPEEIQKLRALGYIR